MTDQDLLFEEIEPVIPEWLRKLVVISGWYNILWGILIILFTDAFFHSLNISVPDYIQLWQITGLLVGIYGIGYLIAASNILRFWPIIFIGLLVKTAVIIGYLVNVGKPEIPDELGWIVLFNDAVWVIPFAMILYYAYNDFVNENKLLNEESFFEMEFNMVETNKGDNLKDLSDSKPVMLIFLRHFGCTFCREMLKDIKKHRRLIEENGKEIVLIHMSPNEVAEQYLKKYGLHDLHHISDKNRDLYRYFGLRRGFISEIVGVKQWVRFAHAGILKRNGIGLFKGDVFQLPGIFIYHQGKIKAKYIHRSASDRPNYVSMAKTIPS